MSRKSKIDPVLKIKAVEDILVGKKGVCEVARELRVDESTVRSWRLIYLSGGPTALANQSRNKVYSIEMKLKAVRDYLDHKGSLRDISQKYGIRNPLQLRCWIKAYNTHGEIKSRGNGGGSYMRKTRKTTYEERLEIVQDCLANDLLMTRTMVQQPRNMSVLISRCVTG